MLTMNQRMDELSAQHVDYTAWGVLKWVSWFSTIGNKPSPVMGMWHVEPDLDENGQHDTSIIHLGAIL